MEDGHNIKQTEKLNSRHSQPTIEIGLKQSMTSFYCKYHDTIEIYF